MLNLAYLLAAVCFIVGLKMLSGPKTAPTGNLVGASGMAVGIIATLWAGGELYPLLDAYRGRLASLFIVSNVALHPGKEGAPDTAALGQDLAQARQRAYAAADRISFAGKFCRSDIGMKGLKRLGLA